MAQRLPPPEQLIRQLAPRYGIDPRAALVVARGEGGLVNRPGSEDIGDEAGGGSYGPFQLYAKGALPASLRGRRDAADAWAWSPQGIDYALRKMAESGARGLRGRAAVEAIIRRFERPANPDASVAKAFAKLGAGSDSAAPVAAGPMVNGSGGRREFALSLLQAFQGGGIDTGKLIEAVQARRAPEALQQQAAPATATSAATKGGSLDALLAELGVADAVTSGDRPGAVTARGGRSDHAVPGRARDINPRDPEFPKLVAHARANPHVYKDFIYSGLPWFIDEGRLHPISALNRTDRDNHRDHAHVSRVG